MSTARPIRHPETEYPYAPGSWELLTHNDKEELIKICGPLVGKTLANPSSIIREQHYAIVGWPYNESRTENLEAVDLGGTTTELLLEKVLREDAIWMTLEQARLVLHRFNARPLEETKWPYVKESDRRATVAKVQTEKDRLAYAAASAHFNELNGTSHAQRMANRRRIAEQKQEAARKEFQSRNAEGRLTDLEQVTLEIEEMHKVAGQQEQIDRDAPFGTTKFGFYIYNLLSEQRIQGIIDFIQQYNNSGNTACWLWLQDPMFRFEHTAMERGPSLVINGIDVDPFLQEESDNTKYVSLGTVRWRTCQRKVERRYYAMSRRPSLVKFRSKM